ncbi:ANTAR domain-containing protein [Angustibacter aerolatus]
MTDHPQIDRFLDGLGEQRARLLRLVGPDADPGELAGELGELVQQLVVAEEELRVQHEELQQTRAQLLRSAGERDQLLGAAEDAHVVTDDQGLVLSVNRAAERLVRQPLARRTPRPLATWFVLDDRHAVRTALGAARDVRDVLPLTPVRLARAGAPDLPVSLEVTRAVEPRTGRTVLRWHLHELATGPHALDEPPAQARPQVDDAVARGVLALVQELADLSEDDREAALPAARRRVVETAVELVPGADGAVLTERVRRHACHPVAATDEHVTAYAHAQAADPTGPLQRAAAGGTVVADDPLGGGVVAVGLGSSRVLAVVGAHPAAFDETAVRATELLAAHAGIALRQVAIAAQLQAAALGRQRVGEAVGVLVERHRITPDVAFERLRAASMQRNLELRRLAELVVDTGLDPMLAGRD